MRLDMKARSEIKEGFIDSIPVILGFIPISITFGLLAKNTGINFRDTTLFSLVVFAGSSQFMALDLIQAGASFANIIIATFLLNFRHFMMSASLSVKMTNIKKVLIPFLAFGITDESFSILSFKEGKLNTAYIFTVHICSQIAWVSGTVIGFLVGEILPSSLQDALGVGLYAMFTALLFPNLKGSKSNILIAIMSFIIYIILFSAKIFTSGWDIILGIIISSALAVVLIKDDKEEEDHE